FLCERKYEKGGYPARLKKVLIVTAPLWFKAPFKILRLFVREKLRERVFTVSVPQLTAHIPRNALPRSLGGALLVDHAAWLRLCLKSMTNRHDDELESLSPAPLAETADSGELLTGERMGSPAGGASPERVSPRLLPTAPANTEEPAMTKKKGSTGGRSPSPEEDEEDELEISPRACSELMQNGSDSCWNGSAEGAPSPAPPASSSASSGFSDDDSLHGAEDGRGSDLEQFVQTVRSKGRAGLRQEYAEIRARPPDGTFNNAKLRTNLAKNRYTDVLCYDHSRVLLSQSDSSDPSTDYINANFVDGYKQKNAFISTQDNGTTLKEFIFTLALMQKRKG
ncbi:hypothetical protein B566_EDAN013572, partial [Ephemera danica]